MPLRDVPLALYIHIPFCAYRCRYCNFTFETGWSPALMQRTLEGLIREAEDLVAQGERDGLRWSISTLYIGGGTPSVVPPELLLPFLGRLESVLGYNTGSLIEATIEANPENVTIDTLQAWQHAGLNRLSVGLQTFDSKRLALLGRWCDRETNLNALELLHQSWPHRWSADLIAGLPGQGDLPAQRWVDLRSDLEQLLRFDPQHVSLYSLTVEPNTDLATLKAGGSLSALRDEVSDQLWLRARETLLAQGFEWYEISNFARPGHGSHHNQTYWDLRPWAGLGPGAEGTLPRRDQEGRLRPYRTRNPRLFPWLTGQKTGEWITAGEFALEHFLSGWRTQQGLNSAQFTHLFGTLPNGMTTALRAEERLLLNHRLENLPSMADLHYLHEWSSTSG